MDDRDIATNGIYFYRLKQVDFDGTSVYTDILAVRIERGFSTDINLYPNPSSDFVTIDITTEMREDITVHLFDLSGRLINTQTIDANDVQSLNAVRVDVKDLPSSIYNVIITIGNEVFKKRIDVVK